MAGRVHVKRVVPGYSDQSRAGRPEWADQAEDQ